MNTIKKAIKFFVILGLLGGVVFVGYKIIFPQPDRMDAYHTTFALIHNEEYEYVQTNIQQMTILMENNVESVNNTTLHKLTITQNTLLSLEASYSFMLDDLAYAKNSAVYDFNAKNVTEKYVEIEQELAKAKSYIQNTVAPFYETESSDASSINVYGLALLKYNKALIEKISDLNASLIEIYNDLIPTMLNNPYSKNALNIVKVWVENQKEFLTTTEALSFEQIKVNSDILLSFATNSLKASETDRYYTEQQDVLDLLLSIEKADIISTTKNVGLVDEETFTSTIEDELVASATLAMFTYLGGR